MKQMLAAACVILTACAELPIQLQPGVDHVIAEAVEGTGLGLAIAREFAEAHGGGISVITRAHGGHFRIVMPRRARRVMAVAA